MNAVHETSCDGSVAIVARPKPVDDAAAIEVVRRKLDPNAITRIHSDPEPAHLPGGVTQGLVAVVEADAEHAVPERLDDLAGHLDLLFFLRDDYLLVGREFWRRTRGPPPCRSTATSREGSHSRPEGLCHPVVLRTPPSRPRRATCSRCPGSR